MAARGGAVLQVSFGPAATPVLPRAVAFAAEHADECTPVGAGTWRATFRLGEDDEAAYGRALQLVHMVYGWRATTVEVSGSPEHRGTVRAMLHCAREWLRSAGSCRATFPGPRIPAKCLKGTQTFAPTRLMLPRGTRGSARPRRLAFAPSLSRW